MPPPIAPGRQIAASLEKQIVKSVRLDYLLSLPPDYESRAQWPLILFLHGSGERGTDVQIVKQHGPPSELDSAPNREFVIVSPQCPLREYWSTDALLTLLDHVEATYKIDRSRVYLTGLSMGGWGVWQLACIAPSRFAAAAPIAGWGLSDLVPNMKDVPVWAFHGEKDPLVPLAWQQEMVDAHRKAGGETTFTVYQNTTHNSWTRTYENPELFAWFLTNRNLRQKG